MRAVELANIASHAKSSPSTTQLTDELRAAAEDKTTSVAAEHSDSESDDADSDADESEPEDLLVLRAGQPQELRAQARALASQGVQKLMHERESLQLYLQGLLREIGTLTWMCSSTAN